MRRMVATKLQTSLGVTRSRPIAGPLWAHSRLLSTTTCETRAEKRRRKMTSAVKCIGGAIRKGLKQQSALLKSTCDTKAPGETGCQPSCLASSQRSTKRRKAAVGNSCLLCLALEEVEDEAEAEDKKSHAEAIDRE